MESFARVAWTRHVGFLLDAAAILIETCFVGFLVLVMKEIANFFFFIIYAFVHSVEFVEI